MIRVIRSILLAPLTALLYVCLYLLGLFGSRALKVPDWLWPVIRVVSAPFTGGEAVAITGGLTSLFSTEYYYVLETRDHEYAHRQQCRNCWRNGMGLLARAVCPIIFAWLYTLETIKNGYWDNKYEVDARLFARQE